MDGVRYCKFCDRRHQFKVMFDPEKNPIALYCDKTKFVRKVLSTVWAGEDLEPLIKDFIREKAKKPLVGLLSWHKRENLSKMFAFKFVEEVNPKLNYYWVYAILKPILFEYAREVKEEFWKEVWK